MIAEVVETMVGIAFGDNVFDLSQIQKETGFKDIAISIAFALFNGCGDCIMRAVDDPDDPFALGRIEVLFKGRNLKFPAAVPIIQLKRAM